MAPRTKEWQPQPEQMLNRELRQPTPRLRNLLSISDEVLSLKPALTKSIAPLRLLSQFFSRSLYDFLTSHNSPDGRGVLPNQR